MSVEPSTKILSLGSELLLQILDLLRQRIVAGSVIAGNLEQGWLRITNLLKLKLYYLLFECGVGGLSLD